MLVAGVAEDKPTVVGREWRWGLAGELAQCRRAVGRLARVRRARYAEIQVARAVL